MYEYVWKLAIRERDVEQRLEYECHVARDHRWLADW
jgi:hypothetical protein